MTDSDITKVCRDCHLELSTKDFHKHPNTEDRLRPECRNCVKAYRRDYYLKRQAELCAYSATYYQDNKEQVRESVQRYSSRNKQRIAQRAKQWRRANQDKLAIDKRQHRLENKGRYAEVKRRYSLDHPEYSRLSTHRRRTRLRLVSGSFTRRQWLAKCAFFGWRCLYCRHPLTGSSAHMDHRKPISRGGSNWIANIAPACKSCNLSKSNKTEKKFRDQICFQKFPTVSVAARDVIA